MRQPTTRERYAAVFEERRRQIPEELRRRARNGEWPEDGVEVVANWIEKRGLYVPVRDLEPLVVGIAAALQHRSESARRALEEELLNEAPE